MQYSIVGVYIPILSEVVVGLDISEIKSIHDHPMFAGKLQETESLDINLNVEQNNTRLLCAYYFIPYMRFVGW